MRTVFKIAYLCSFTIFIMSVLTDVHFVLKRLCFKHSYSKEFSQDKGQIELSVVFGFYHALFTIFYHLFTTVRSKH